MKKLIVILSLLLLVTGCTVTRIDKYGIDDVVENILYRENDFSNQHFSGYKYYLPQGVTILEKNEYNSTLLLNKEKMYLYVDVISYFHKSKMNYEEKDDIYYSKELKNKKSFGYLEVTLVDDMYYVDMMYNYAKIEGYTEKRNLNSFLVNASYILSSIQFNDKVIESLIGENAIEYKEETFDIFKSDDRKSDSSVLDYDEEYDNIIKEQELKDEDVITDNDDKDLE